jgi:hypothetical protein
MRWPTLQRWSFTRTCLNSKPDELAVEYPGSDKRNSIRAQRVIQFGNQVLHIFNSN